MVSKFVVQACKSKKAKVALSNNRKPNGLAPTTTSNGLASSTNSKQGVNTEAIPFLLTPPCVDDVNSALLGGAATPFTSSSSSSSSHALRLAAVALGSKPLRTPLPPSLPPHSNNPTGSSQKSTNSTWKNQTGLKCTPSPSLGTASKSGE